MACAGLLDGYVAEKATLEESLLQKEAQEERLVEELELLKAKLHQMQGLGPELDNLRLKHQELSEEHTLLLRQKEHLSSDLGDTERGELANSDPRYLRSEIKCDVTSLASMTTHLHNVYAQMCLFPPGQWLNLDPETGLWARVEYECVWRGDGG